MTGNRIGETGDGRLMKHDSGMPGSKSSIYTFLWNRLKEEFLLIISGYFTSGTESFGLLFGSPSFYLLSYIIQELNSVTTQGITAEVPTGDRPTPL